MNITVFIALVFFSATARAENWVLLAKDEAAKTFVDAPAAQDGGHADIRFRIKEVYSARKDMMGLEYTASMRTYVLSCKSKMISFRQQFLLMDEQIVWTYPAVTDVRKAGQELPADVLARLCGDPGDGRQ